MDDIKKLQAVRKLASELENKVEQKQAKAQQSTMQAIDLVVSAFKKFKEDVKAQMEVVRSIPPEKGDKGEKGDPGLPGANGKDGRDGKDGKDGQDGQDGVSVVDARLDFDGHLVMVLSNGTEIDAGVLAPEKASEIYATLKQTIDGGGGSALTISDEGVTLTSGATKINFVGAGVTATASGDEVTVSIAGGGSGTVTSVDLSVPTGFAVSGNPITTSGTLALAYAAGYSLPTNVKQSNWDDAYTAVTNLGTISTQDSNNVSITGGSITGITDLAVADGGTGASTASGARTNLLPSYAGNAGKVLAVNGGATDVEWITASGGGGGGGGVTVSDTPPASPSSGTLWYDTKSGALFTWYVGTSSSAWVSAADTSPQIPVQFISQASASTTSIATMPTHRTGDLLLMFAYRNNSATAPTAPAGWTTLRTAGSNTNSFRLAFKFATSSSEVSGTWTNATQLNLHVYRNVLPTFASTAASNTTTGASTSISYPGMTLSNTNGGSLVAAFAGHRSTNTSITTAPTGTTLRSNTIQTAGFDTNTGVTSWTTQTVSVGGTSSGWQSVVLELPPRVGLYTTLGTITFPASPVVGDTYTQSGHTFVWNGTAWLYLPWVDLASAEVTGTLPVSKGGTGLTTLTADNVILGNGTGTPSFVAPGTAGNVLTSNGTTWVSSPAGGGSGGGAAVKGLIVGGSLQSMPGTTGITSVVNMGSYIEVYLNTTAYFFNVSNATTSPSSMSVFDNFIGSVRVYGSSTFYITGFA